MIPAEAVEAAARVHYDSSPTHRATWVQLSVGYRRELMEPMRAALEAAAPHLMRAAWDEGNDAHEASPLNRNPYAPMTRDAV